MTTTEAPGATGTATKSITKFDILCTAAVYALAVWYIVHTWADPHSLRLMAAGTLVPFVAPHLPLLRKLPRWAGVILGWLALAVVISDRAYESMLLGVCWLFVVGLPAGALAVVVLAWFASRSDDDSAHAGDLEPPERIIVGLSGYAGAGKDTAAEGLLQLGFTRVSFADTLREVALATNPLVPVVVRGIGGEPDRETYMRLDNYVDLHGWTEAKKNLEVRGLLQRLGTEAGRKVLGENVWVDAVMNNLPEGNLVFTDMRFPNEYEAIVSQPGGLAVRINRPGVTAINAHPSETALDGHLFHANIENNASPTKVAALLAAFVQQHTGVVL